MADVTEVLDRLGVEYARPGDSKHVSDGWVGLVCPWCDRGKGNFGLGVNVHHGWCNCWSCGRHSFTEALGLITGLPWRDLRPLTAGMSLGPFEGHRKRSGGILCEPEGIGELLPVHRKYLRGRGFNPDQVGQLWQVSGIGWHPRLAWRLYLPVTFHDRRVSWTTRAVGEGVRYMAASPEEEATPIKSTLYGHDYVRASCLVVEGPTDAWRLGPGAVATYGTGYSREQVALLSTIPQRVVVYDRGREAQAAAKRLCRELSWAPGRTVRYEVEADDPGECTPEEVEYVRREYLS